ncbi:DUF488 domain-containing protein [Oenococcus alcoholitolerans]|uniref:DUF488 domain-containing protein n=1 Tax=Oenococcus alcoholitolerans TaxID=931074 RepID=UPI003F727095
MVQFERIYGSQSKGYRILIDATWPSGLSKEKADIDLWAKDIAPSTELAKDFQDGDIDEMAFRAVYLTELSGNPASKDFLQTLADHPDCILLFAAKDQRTNNAKILADYLKRQGLESTFENKTDQKNVQGDAEDGKDKKDENKKEA